MKKYLFKTQLLSLAALCGIVLAFASCANEDVVQNTTGAESDNDKNLTAFFAGDEATTRTSLDYNSGNFYWEAGDYIYVKDDNGVLQKSSNAPTSKVASFKYMVPGKFTASSSYKVYYLGKNSNGNSVTISTNQSQTTPDNTVHFGTVGDYGTATANKVSSKQQFKFELEHQPAYLVFQPYTSNTILRDCYLTKVEVSSDNDIAETYTVNPTTGSLVASSGTGAKQIVLATQDLTSGSTYNNGFPLTNNSASVTTNGAYMVIKPGTHTLKVRYWVKDVATNVEGTITKTYPSSSYASNTYYDMTANLDVKNYDGNHYYMWDAQQNYWSGHEWNSANPWQPVLNNNSNSNYAQSNSDPRWDADELWSTMGHLYKGGMWFKKMSVLKAENHYDAEKSANGSLDMRKTWTNYSNSSSSIKSGVPSAADAGNYFYLPALGNYPSGHLSGVGSYGSYWSSSVYPKFSGHAVALSFGNDYVFVSNYRCDFGFIVETSQEFLRSPASDDDSL